MLLFWSVKSKNFLNIKQGEKNSWVLVFSQFLWKLAELSMKDVTLGYFGNMWKSIFHQGQGLFKSLLVMGTGISEPENCRQNPSFFNTRQTRTRLFKFREFRIRSNPTFSVPDPLLVFSLLSKTWNYPIPEISIPARTRLFPYPSFQISGIPVPARTRLFPYPTHYYLKHSMMQQATILILCGNTSPKSVKGTGLIPRP